MNLYDNKEIFNQLSSSVALQKGIPEEAVRRDYLIVTILYKLSIQKKYIALNIIDKIYFFNFYNEV